MGGLWASFLSLLYFIFLLLYFSIPSMFVCSVEPLEHTLYFFRNQPSQENWPAQLLSTVALYANSLCLGLWREKFPPQATP
jgi:hypothetical protein